MPVGNVNPRVRHAGLVAQPGDLLGTGLCKGYRSLPRWLVVDFSHRHATSDRVGVVFSSLLSIAFSRATKEAGCAIKCGAQVFFAQHGG